MTISSNIEVIFDRLDEIEREIPIAVNRACHRASWRDQAEAIARTTLTSICPPELLQYAEAFARTVTYVPEVMGFWLRMDGAAQDVAMTDDMRTIGSFKLFEANVLDYENLILEFVQTDEKEMGKRKAARDWTKTDIKVAKFLTTFMLRDPSKLSWDALIARDKLQGHIDEFLEYRMKKNVDTKMLETWFKAVMENWIEWLRDALPEAIREELHKI